MDASLGVSRTVFYYNLTQRRGLGTRGMMGSDCESEDPESSLAEATARKG